MLKRFECDTGEINCRKIPGHLGYLDVNNVLAFASLFKRRRYKNIIVAGYSFLSLEFRILPIVIQ